MQMKFKRLLKLLKGLCKCPAMKCLYVQVFGPEHHGRVRGCGDGISLTELWGSSSSTIRDLQIQLKESEERSKENDANLLRKLKESEEHCKESDANVQLLKAQVNRVESLLAQVLKNMAPFELAQSDCSS